MIAYNYNMILPIGSMYGIYANIGGILMVNVTIYSIHGSYGLYNPHNNHHYNHEISLYMGLLENSVARMPYWFITIVPTISWLFRVFPIFRQTYILYIYIHIIERDSLAEI